MNHSENNKKEKDWRYYIRQYLRNLRQHHSIHQIWINTILLKANLTHHSTKRRHRIVDGIVLYYRICDAGYQKVKPNYITKENCLANAVTVFPLDKVEWHVLADNICEETYLMILKYVPQEQVERVSIGNGAGTFQRVLEAATKLPSSKLVYFLEDDYVHIPNSLQYLIEAGNKNLTDYFTLYDPPDKYDTNDNNTNPFSNDGGENTKVFWCGTHHWKLTNSTTMTFAAFADILRRDKKFFLRWTNGHHPYDYELFNDLRISRGALISSPIPSLSSHGETHFLAPGINWEYILNQQKKEST